MSVEVFQATPPARSYRFELLPEGAMDSALKLLEQPLEGTVPEELDNAVERGLRRALDFANAQAAEQRAALVLLSELATLDFAEKKRRLQEHLPRFRSTRLCHLLLEKCAEEAHGDVHQARECSQLALLAVELLDRQALPLPIWHDIKAEALSVVADTQRLTFDLIGAKSAIAEAERHLRAGSGTLMVRAELLIKKASLCCDLEHFEDGLRAIDQALSILRAGGKGPEIARGLMVKGRLFLEHGRPEEARPFFKKAQELLASSPDRALKLSSHHNLAACLCELGRTTEARWPLREAFETARLLSRPLSILHLRWLEGRLAAETAELDHAESSLLEAMEGFHRRGLRIPAGKVALDLARFYISKRRLSRLHRPVRPLLLLLPHHRAAWRQKPVTDRSL